MTGADFISEDIGRKLESVDVNSLGQSHRVISTKDNTTIVGGKGSKEEIEKESIRLNPRFRKPIRILTKKSFRNVWVNCPAAWR